MCREIFDTPREESAPLWRKRLLQAERERILKAFGGLDSFRAKQDSGSTFGYSYQWFEMQADHLLAIIDPDGLVNVK